MVPVIRPNQAGESILIRGGVVGRDRRGRPIYDEGRTVEHCVVSPAGDQVVRGQDFVHGDISKLQVIAPPGTKVEDGDVVVIRGEDFMVDQLVGFDYSPGRKPAVGHHRPPVVFVVERGEVSSHVS